MSLTPDHLVNRLTSLEMQLHAMRGYVKALEYGLHSVIASHPAPVALSELWVHVLPELADMHGGEEEAPPLFNAAFQQALAALSEHIDGALRRHSASE